jgi:hypothetical protein
MAVANDVAAYIGVEGGMVLDSFRKAVADRRAPRMETPKEPMRPDEKGLLNVLLSDIEGRDGLLADLRSLEILDRIATRRIYQAVASAHAGGAAVTFDGVMARLDAPDQNLLAELALSEDAGNMEISIEYGRQCLENLRRSGGQTRLAQIKALIKEAERAGNFPEALRLTGELQTLGRAG